MKLPIPNDWSGNWHCVQIQWPDSVLWNAILIGLLTRPEAGRSWDERTGSVKDAQAIGAQIYLRNFPFKVCKTSDCEDTEKIVYVGGGTIESEAEMGQVVTDVTYDSETGILRVEYSHCCFEEYFIGGGGSVKPPIADDDDIIIEEPTGGWSACGKAAAVLDIYRKLLESIWDERDSALAGTSIYNVYEDVPGMGIDEKWLIAALLSASWVHLAMIEPASDYLPDPFDASTWQSVQCQLALWFKDDQPGPDYSGNDIREKVQELFRAEWGLDLLMAGMFNNAGKAINRVDWENAATIGAANDQESCDCPEVYQPETDPTENGWYLGIVHEITVPKSGYNTPYCLRLIPQHDVYGCVFWFEWTSPGGGDLGRSSGGCQNYDVSAWGDTSDHYEDTEPQTAICAAPQSVAEELLGVGVLLSQASYMTDQVANPTFTPGMVGAHGFNMNAMEDGTEYSVRFRLIHNVNSPSHGA